MERELWLSFYRIAHLLDKGFGRWKYSTADILAVYHWSVLNSKPISWACDRENWQQLWQGPLPDQSTLSRRLRHSDVQQLMSDIELLLGTLGCLAQRWLRVIDGKGLPIGGVSKDPDAGYGRCAGGMAKGYKLFAVWGGGPLPIAWGLGRMNVSEKAMARLLLPTLPGWGVVLADKEYDSNPLFELTRQADYQLLATRRCAGAKSVGHRPQSQDRLRCLEVMNAVGGRINRRRKQIERDFGNLTSSGFGLSPLPAWVRRFHRVRNYIHAKLLANAVSWFRKHEPKQLAFA